MKRVAFIACLGLLTAVSCRRQDLRTVPIHVPDMKNEGCVELVVEAINRVSGVLRNETRVDHETRTVFVTYDSLKLSMKNIEFAVADIGFAANTVPADEEAARELPAECR